MFIRTKFGFSGKIVKPVPAYKLRQNAIKPGSVLAIASGPGVSRQPLIESLKSVMGADMQLMQRPNTPAQVEAFRETVGRATENGTTVILSVDARHAASVKDIMPDAQTVFVHGPGEDSKGLINDFDMAVSERHSVAGAENLAEVIEQHLNEGHAPRESLIWKTTDPAFSRIQSKLPQVVLEETRDALDDLEVERISVSTPSTLAATDGDLFLLESRLSQLLQAHQPKSVRTDLEHSLRRVLNVRDQVFHATVRLEQGAKAVTPEALRLIRWTNKEWVQMPASKYTEVYETKLGKFAAKGGDFSRRQPLTRAFIDALLDEELCEFAMTSDHGVTIAEAKYGLGHLLLAYGKDVFTAGSLKVFRNLETKEFSRVELGTFSGSFLSDKESLVLAARELVKLGVAEHIIFMTENEAASLRVHDILASLSETPPDVHKARLERLEALADAALPPPKATP